jgi:hypothetical protein
MAEGFCHCERSEAILCASLKRRTRRERGNHSLALEIASSFHSSQ